MTQIIGICQIRNEEHYIERVITNIYEFCDRIIVLDNNSGDRTPVIVSHMAMDMEMSKIDLHPLVHRGRRR